METMTSTADTLTPTGVPVTLAGPPPETAGSGGSTSYPYAPTSFAVMGSNPDEILVASDNTTGNHQYISGYDLSGNLLFRDDLQSYNTVGPSNNLELATIPGGGVAAAWYQYSSGFHGVPATSDVHYTVVSPDGSTVGLKFAQGSNGSASALQTLPSRDGFILEWQDVGKSGNTAGNYTQLDRYHADGSVISNNYLGHAGPFAWVDIGLAGGELGIQDNLVFMTGNPGITVPGEPAHAITGLAAAPLTDGHSAAVAWVDSGTDYVSIYNATTNSFGPTIGLDWGGAKDLHTVALADGGFAVSWSNGGQYRGELFAADGTGGGVLSLTGQFAALDSHGELYTVGLDSDGAYVVQTFAVNGPGSTGGGSTGGGSTGGGQTYTSDNAGDHWTGTAGNDVFNLGRGGDLVAGAGGDDTFKFAEVPWAGGHITDFNAGDVLDLTALARTTEDIGTDGFADGYLSIRSDAQGNAQIWASYSSSGSSPWLVTTLDSVAATTLIHQGDVITVGPSAPGRSTVHTSDSSYTAAPDVGTIIMEGSSAQTVHGNDAGDVFVSTNNGGNRLYGGTGVDLFHLGRGGDTVAGGAGADTFAFAETPWAGGHITDFDWTQGDAIELTGMLAKSGYVGTDPIGGGYIKFTETPTGAQIWTDMDGPGSASGWWLVDTLDGVSGSALSLHDGVVAGGGSGVAEIPFASYTALRGVTTIDLTGNGSQDIRAHGAGQTIVNNDMQRNVLGSGSGTVDTFVINSAGAEITLVPSFHQGEQQTIAFTGLPTSQTTIDYFTPGQDRIDIRGLLQAAHYTGSDPVMDGYLKMVSFSTHQVLISFDPDGHGSASSWTPVAFVDSVNVSPQFQLHYADGWLT
jgi:hypothetical protein